MKNTKSFKKIWLFLTAACVLIVIASLVLAFVLRNKATSDQNLTRSGALYWNVDRADFQSGIKRTPNGNGNYVVTFSSQGESQRIEVSSEAYANGIDMHEIVSLVFDENGVAVDYLTVPECTGGFYVSGFYVEQIDGDTSSPPREPITIPPWSGTRQDAIIRRAHPSHAKACRPVRMAAEELCQARRPHL